MLAPASGSLQIDATLGGGGHTERILEATNPDGRLLGLDADGAAIARVPRPARPRFGDRLRPPPGELPRARGPSRRRRASARSTAACSTSACRASSWPTRTVASASAPAARSTCASTPRRGVPAAELLATLDAERADRALPAVRRGAAGAGRIARAIVEARRTAPIRTAEELAALVERVAPPNPRQPRRIHPATRVFQALRIAVNEELDALEAGARRRRGPAAARRPARRPELPLARGPHRQAVLRGGATRLHLPARGAGVRLRPQPRGCAS